MSPQVIVDLIAATDSKTGLNVHAQIDTERFPAGLKVSDQELAAVIIERNPFIGDSNYKILPLAIGPVVS